MNRRQRAARRATLALAAALCAGTAGAECPSDDQVAALDRAIQARPPAPTPTGLSAADGAGLTAINAVVWLAQALAKDGLALQPVQLVSLGSFTPLAPPSDGLTVPATCHGRPGAQPVMVSFHRPDRPTGCAIGPQTNEARQVACYRPFIR